MLLCRSELSWSGWSFVFRCGNPAAHQAGAQSAHQHHQQAAYAQDAAGEHGWAHRGGRSAASLTLICIHDTWSIDEICYARIANATVNELPGIWMAPKSQGWHRLASIPVELFHIIADQCRVCIVWLLPGKNFALSCMWLDLRTT